MHRFYTALFHELLSLFPCVAIVGVRQCGKTTLLKQLPAPWRIFDLEKASDADRNTCSRFVIMGSSSPELVAAISESLAPKLCKNLYRA